MKEERFAKSSSWVDPRGQVMRRRMTWRRCCAWGRAGEPSLCDVRAITPLTLRA